MMILKVKEDDLIKYINKYKKDSKYLMFIDNLTSKFIRQAKKESSLLIYSTRYESHLDDMSFGIYQLLSSTIESLGFDENKEDIFDIETQVKYGIKYINLLFSKFPEVYNIDERLSLAFASYNCGRGNINKALARLMKKENIAYDGRDTKQGKWSNYDNVNKELVSIIGKNNADINKRYVNYIMKGV